MKRYKVEIDSEKDLGLIFNVCLLFKEKRLSQVFPNLFIILAIFCAIPVTSASAERSFSILKLIKLWIRNSMGQDRLSDLAKCSIEK